MYFLLIFYNIKSGQIYDYIPVEDDSSDILCRYCNRLIWKLCPSGSLCSVSHKKLVDILKSINVSYYFYNLEDVKNIIRGMVK